jgi:hypothetical protein
MSHFLCILALLLLCLHTHAEEKADWFANNGFGKPISTMQHPCAEYFKGVTYIAYQGPHEDPYVCAYKHDAAEWSGPFKAGVSALGSTPDPTDPDKVDNHGRPALIVDREGYIHLIFGGHGGSFLFGKNQLGTPGAGRQTHVVTTKPQDISEWQVLDNVPPFGTYSQFVKTPDGDIYLFYRHGSHRSDWVYQKSTDNCRTFAAPVSILKSQPQTGKPNVHDAWYASFNAGKGNTITAIFHHHPCAVFGHKKPRYNTYFMRMDCAAADTWKTVQGTPVSLPVTKESADKLTLVTATDKSGVRTGICRVDDAGNPHILIKQSPALVYYRWTGSAWHESVALADAASAQEGDILINSPSDIRLLMSCEITNRSGIAWWQSTDGGTNWQQQSTVATSENASLIMAALVRNAHPDAQIVYSRIEPNQENLYRKMFLFGNRGLVKR